MFIYSSSIEQRRHYTTRTYKTMSGDNTGNFIIANKFTWKHTLVQEIATLN
jgi:hypothetical protein